MTSYNKIYIVYHSHIDITWWDKPDVCRERIIEIVNKVIEFSKKYPNFKFSFETTYPIIEFLNDYPYRKNEIIELLDKNIIEIGGLYVSAISDICFDELIISNLCFGKKWLMENLNYNTEIAIEEDIPGHAYQMPQILRQANIKYFKISRGPQGVYLWQGLNKDKILTCLIDYGTLAPKRQFKSLQIAKREIPKIIEKAKHKHKIEFSSLLLPLGDDNELPKEEIITFPSGWNEENQPSIELSTYSDYLKKIEKEKIKEISGNIPNLWTVLSSFEPEIVRNLRESKYIVKSCEVFSAIANMIEDGFSNFKEEIDKIYKLLLLVSDHNFGARSKNHYPVECDLLKKNYIDSAISKAENILKLSIDAISKNINFEKDGIKILVFNPTFSKKTDIVEIESSKLKKINFKIKDRDNKEIPYQIKNDKVIFVAENIPSCGYKTYYVEEVNVKQEYKSNAKIYKNTIENKFYKIQFAKDGSGIISIFDKELKKDFCKKFKVNFFKRMMEMAKKEGKKITLKDIKDILFNLPKIFKAMNIKFSFGEIWSIGARLKQAPEGYYEREEVEAPGEEVELTGELYKASDFKSKINGSKGPVFSSLISSGNFIDSKKEIEIMLYENIKRIDYKIRIDWNGKNKTVISVAFPTNLENQNIYIDIPYGVYKLGDDVVEFEESSENVGGFKIRGVQDFIDICNDNFGFLLSTKLPAFDFTFFPNLFLIFSDDESAFFFGDYYLHKDKWEFNFSITTYRVDNNKAKIWRDGKNVNFPLFAKVLENKSTNSDYFFPDEFSFFEIEPDNLIVSSFKKENLNSYVIRVYEIEGKYTQGKIKLYKKVNECYTCDILGENLNKIDAQNDTISVSLNPYEIKTIKFSFCNDQP